MMEKNGMLTLNERDMTLYREGVVSKRVKEGWELDFESLDGIIKAGSFTLIDVNSEDKSGDK